MVKRRKNPAPALKSDKWKKDPAGFYLDPKDLELMIAESSRTIEQIKAFLGSGFEHIQELRDGKRLDPWSAYIVERALIPGTGEGGTIRFYTNAKGE